MINQNFTVWAEAQKSQGVSKPQQPARPPKKKLTPEEKIKNDEEKAARLLAAANRARARAEKAKKDLLAKSRVAKLKRIEDAIGGIDNLTDADIDVICSYLSNRHPKTATEQGEGAKA